MNRIPELDVLAAGQHGIFTRAQVLICGGTDDWIEAQLAARRIRRLHRKVYSLVTGEPTESQRHQAALLCAGGRAALSHATAARLHGLRLLDDGTVHITVPYGHSADDHDGVAVHRSRAFEHITVDHAGLPIVSAADTCVDLAVQSVDGRAAMRTVLHAALGMKVEGHHLRAVLDVRRPARYARAIADAARLLDEGVTSALEARYATDVEDAHGFPRGYRQAPEDVFGTTRYEDCEYVLPGGTLTVRLDGWRYHSDRRVALADRARDNAAELQGRGRLTFGWEEIHEPCRMAGIVAAALRARGWPGPVAAGASCACVPVLQHGNARTRRQSK